MTKFFLKKNFTFFCLCLCLILLFFKIINKFVILYVDTCRHYIFNNNFKKIIKRYRRCRIIFLFWKTNISQYIFLFFWSVGERERQDGICWKTATPGTTRAIFTHINYQIPKKCEKKTWTDTLVIQSYKKKRWTDP